MLRVPERRTVGRRQRGFTLLEVLVATVLAGIGLGVAFAAISGSLRLAHKGFEHEAAMQLARGKLAEVMASANYTVAEEADEYRYGGIAYGFRIEVRPLPLLPAQYAERIRLPFALDEVTINVYWGPEGAQQSYALTAYRKVDLAQSSGDAGRDPRATGSAVAGATASGASGGGTPDGGRTAGSMAGTASAFGAKP